MTNTQLYFLGPTQLKNDNQPLKLTNNKGIALLLYLAVKRDPQRREHVMDLLWPDSLPQSARKNMRNTLWQIRKTLGDEFIQVEADRLRLGQNVWLDLNPFEQLTLPSRNVSAIEEAVALYRAPLAEGLHILEAPTFELWLTGERERLNQHYLRLLEALVFNYQTDHKWRQVINTAQRALTNDNLQEPLYQALMKAYTHLGERHEALHIYETLQNILAQELGVTPLPATQNLRQTILEGHLPMPDKLPNALEPPPTAPAHPPPTTPFVGRELEHQILDTALKAATNNQAQIVMLYGELGIGKSRLWQRWSSTLPHALAILETRCLDTTQSLPFAPLARLLSQSQCFERLFELSSPLSMTWLAELARFFPQIREHHPEIPLPAAVPPEEERRRLFEAFTQAFLALESLPFLLFIDDLHWADQTTLDWLLYLTDRLRHKPFLLVGTYRSSDAPARLKRMIANWNREGIIRHLPLQRLTLPEAKALITALGGDITLAQQLHTKSAGNPYFLIELNRVDPEDTPPELADLLNERLNHLPETAQQVMQAAAVLEAGFEFTTLRHTSGRGEEEILNATDALLKATLLAEKDGGYEFSHPLVATIVRDSLSLARRQFLNRRAAEALEATYTANLAPIAGRIAAHYHEANKPKKAAHYAALAGEHALDLSAFVEAADFYRQAFSWDPTPARKMALGWALFRLPGEGDNARDILEQAIIEFENLKDPAGVVEACLTLAFTFLPSGQGNKIITWVDHALPYLEVVTNPEAEARAHFLLGASGFRMGRPMREAESHFKAARQLATEHQLFEVAAMSWFESGNLLLHRGDFEQAQQAFQQSLTFVKNRKNIYQEAIGFNNLAYAHLLAGNIEQAKQHLKQGLSIADTYALLLPRQYLYSTYGEVALSTGQLDQAEQWFKKAISVAQQFDNAMHITNIQANLALLAQARGDLDQALTLLTTTHTSLEESLNPYLYTKIYLWLAELYLQRDEKSAAQKSLTQAEKRLTGTEQKGLKSWAKRIRGLIKG